MEEETDTQRFSSVLDGLAHAPGERLSLLELVEAFGERAFGAVLLVISLINMLPLPPGGTTITGAPLLLVAAQLAIGRDTLWLPRRLLDATLARETFAKGVARAGPTLRTAERLTRPRLPVLVTDLSERLIGLAVLVLGPSC